MSADKPMISIDGEWLLTRIQRIEGLLDEIRSEAARGAYTQPTPEGIDLEAINWLVKGSEPFTPGDTWGWAFAYDQNNHILVETRELVKIIERDGKAIIDGYVIKLGGRDGNLLNRQKVKR